MSAVGQKRTSWHARLVFALPPKADIGDHGWNVRFVPCVDVYGPRPIATGRRDQVSMLTTADVYPAS
jgi:hypothetical protein